MSVATKSQRQKQLEIPRVLPRTLMLGTDAMIAAGTAFMPQHAAEEDKDYKRRLTSTTLYNGFKDAVWKQSGKLFTKDIILSDDAPPEIIALSENIDGQGRNLSSFAFDTFSLAMVDGISFIYVDFPPVTVNDEGFATALDQQTQGARPSSILINSSDILGIKTENILGTLQLTEVRIMEEAIEQDPDDEHVEIYIKQVRLSRSGSYELWREDNSNAGGIAGDSWYLYEEGTTSLNYIPLIPVYTNRTGFMEGYPPLRPLAELNKEHWNSSSEQRNALTFARFAMIVFSGVDEQTVIQKLSPNTVFKLPHGASASAISTSGTGIEQGFIDIDKIQERMQHTGMSIRVQSTGSTTATEAQINSAESNSALLAAASGLENSLDAMLQVFADYMGLTNSGRVRVNKSFGESQAQGTLQELQTMYVTTGVPSRETLLNEAKRRGVLAEDVDVKQEIERANDEDLNSLEGINGINAIQSMGSSIETTVPTVQR